MCQIGGLAAGGAVLNVPLIDLVWLPPRNPDDDEDVPRLPTLEGWFKVRPEGEEVEGFPEGIEINISIILTKIILDEDEIKDANVIDVCVCLPPCKYLWRPHVWCLVLPGLTCLVLPISG